MVMTLDTLAPTPRHSLDRTAAAPAASATFHVDGDWFASTQTCVLVGGVKPTIGARGGEVMPFDD